MVKIKNIKKFKKFNMRIENNTVLLICKNGCALEKTRDYDNKKLITDIYNLGKNINNILNTHFINEKRIISINTENIKFNKLDTISTNTNVINLFKNYFSKNPFYKKLTDESCLNKYDIDGNDGDNLINTYREITDYKSFFDFYSNSYNLLQKNKIDVSKLSTPQKIHDMILWDFYGIGIINKKEIKKQNNLLNIEFKQLLDILEKNKSIIDYRPLINDTHYLPLNIRYWDQIIENNPNNTSTKKFFELICNFCNNYGLPYWKEEIKDNPNRKEIYGTNDIEIPMNNFLLISLAIFIYTELWKLIIDYDKYDDFEEYNYAFYVLNIDFYYGESKKEIIKKLIDCIEKFDIYISTNCNELLNYHIYNYRKKIINKDNTLSNEIQYESIIIAAWDIFYNSYFGNSKIFTPIKYPLCSECNKEIRNKPHTIRDGTKRKLCDNCFNIRENIQNIKRVDKYNSKISKN